MKTNLSQKHLAVALTVLALVSCASPEPEGLRLTDEGTGAEVKFDLFHRPLPEIPFPNDIATRFDPSSPTKRRVNASMKADTDWEHYTRAELDTLDGFGTYAPITVSFTKPLDVEVLYQRHQGDDYDFSNDAALVLDINPDSPEFCQAVPLDMGEGNFPLTLERQKYFPNDPREHTQQLMFEEVDEDLNRNGKLDPGEDTDMDGVLDKPNTRHPDARALDVMTFYERETNTLILKPVMPMREANTYAVVLTRRLLDEDGRPVRSPFKYINHTAQTAQLGRLERCLGFYGLEMKDVAFTWPFTTQSISAPFVAIRDGMYGLGPMSRLAQEYPAEVSRIFDLRTGSEVNVKIVPGSHFLSAATDLLKSLYGGNITPDLQAIIDSHKFIDFHVMFTIESPQFFPRVDAEGNRLPLYRQTWKVDPVTGEHYSRPETLTLWVTVPKHRNGRPAPVSILGHGYTGNKLDPLWFGGFLARFGMATIGVEAVSHGIGVPAADRELAKGLMASKGLEPMHRAAFSHRAEDQNGDGIEDSGADYWTGHMFHTRDVVRQSTVDYMRIIQVLRSFDGQSRWKFDVNKDGQPELAGDFDADGVVDFGGDASITMTGASLGGILSTVLGGVEPHVTAVVPVSGGGGLTEVGSRSVQGGVAEAVNLLTFGPLLVTLRDANGGLHLWQYVPDLNGLGTLELGPMEVEPTEGDTAVMYNLKTGRYRCARVQANGLLRVGVSSDEGDPLRLELYSGVLPPQPEEGCVIPEGTTPYWTRGELLKEVKFQGKTFEVGSPLIAHGIGFGMRRGSPELRRMLGLGQMVIDAGDPVNFAPFFERRLLRYGTGEVVRTRAIVVNTIGDMNVPMATGAAIARAAGFIELYNRDARWGKTPNRVLIDTGALESVERTRRHLNSNGEPVLFDVEHFSLITGADDGFDTPRLSPPLRLVGPTTRLGGYSGALFPMVSPKGKHGFDRPDPSKNFDLGSLLQNMLGQFLASDGREFTMEPCMEDSSCTWIPPIPPQ